MSKERLDVHIRSTGRKFSVGFSAAGLRKLRKEVRQAGVGLAVMEATGKLEARAARALEAGGTPVAVVNPGRIREFARASGKMAKTDAIDAGVIAHYAEAMEPRPRTPPTEAQREAAALMDRRRELVGMVATEKNRLGSPEIGPVRARVAKHVRWLEKELAGTEKELEEAISGDPEMAAKRELLMSVPGVGDVVANTLITGLPELGQAGKKEIASLAGLAPFNRDSGKVRGKRTTYGGRSTVRTAVYMASLSAIRKQPEMVEFYKRMLGAGKPKKLALTAVARKLLVMLNAMVQRGTTWQPSAP